MALTSDQQQSVQDSGGYYDDTGNWIDMSSGQPSGQQSPAAGQGGVNPWLGILTALGSAIGGRAIASHAASAAVPPELRQLLAQSVQRQTFQNPLFEAQTRGVYSMLPNFAREGTSLGPSMGNAPPQIQQSDSGGGINPLLAAGLGAGGGAALMKLLGGGGSPGSGGNIPLQQIVDGIKKLFSHRNNNPVGPTQNPYHGPDATYEPGGYNFAGPTQDPFNGPDATYEPGGYNFAGPTQSPYTGPDATYDPGGYNFSGPTQTFADDPTGDE